MKKKNKENVSIFGLVIAFIVLLPITIFIITGIIVSVIKLLLMFVDFWLNLLK